MDAPGSYKVSEHYGADGVPGKAGVFAPLFQPAI